MFSIYHAVQYTVDVVQVLATQHDKRRCTDAVLYQQYCRTRQLRSANWFSRCYITSSSSQASAGDPEFSTILSQDDHEICENLAKFVKGWGFLGVFSFILSWIVLVRLVMPTDLCHPPVAPLLVTALFRWLWFLRHGRGTVWQSAVCGSRRRHTIDLPSASNDLSV